MKEKLIIKNFGPIRSVELDLGKINILIGKQATGKSTIAKVLAVCRYFSYIIDVRVLEMFETSFYTGLVDWGLKDFLYENSYWYYENKDYSLEVQVKEEETYYLREEFDKGSDFPLYIELFTPKLSAKSYKFKKLLDDFYEIQPKSTGIVGLIESSYWLIPTSFLTNQVKKVMDNPFYFPTERGLQSIFSLGKSSIQNLSDALFNQLSDLDSIASIYKSETLIEPLGIYYKNENGRGYIAEKNGINEYHSLANGASGYQSTIPIVLTVKYYNEIERRKRTFIIEEPEQNLFPTAQKALVEFLVSTVNEYDNTFLLPTHSPYIISALNNLISAHRVGQKKPEEINKIIDKKYWISIDDVSAYRLYFDEKSGGIISGNLVLEDLKEISVDYLDEISATINKEWDRILDAEDEDEKS